MKIKYSLSRLSCWLHFLAYEQSGNINKSPCGTYMHRRWKPRMSQYITRDTLTLGVYTLSWCLLFCLYRCTTTSHVSQSFTLCSIDQGLLDRRKFIHSIVIKFLLDSLRWYKVYRIFPTVRFPFLRWINLLHSFFSFTANFSIYSFELRETFVVFGQKYRRNTPPAANSLRNNFPDRMHSFFGRRYFYETRSASPYVKVRLELHLLRVTRDTALNILYSRFFFLFFISNRIDGDCW